MLQRLPAATQNVMLIQPFLNRLRTHIIQGPRRPESVHELLKLAAGALERALEVAGAGEGGWVLARSLQWATEHSTREAWEKVERAGNLIATWLRKHPETDPLKMAEDALSAAVAAYTIAFEQGPHAVEVAIKVARTATVLALGDPARGRSAGAAVTSCCVWTGWRPSCRGWKTCSSAWTSAGRR